MENKREIFDRFRGAILGLAVGDALGVPSEFTNPGSFEPVNDMRGGGPSHLESGMWTDDTSLAHFWRKKPNEIIRNKNFNKDYLKGV
jgi:ADP-ribosylglycohydrolase